MSNKPPEPQVIGQIQAFGQQLNILQTCYANGGGLAFKAESLEGEPYGTFSVNLPAGKLSPGTVVVKVRDEYAPLRGPLLQSGLFEDTSLRTSVNYGHYEIWRRTELVHATA